MTQLSTNDTNDTSPDVNGCLCIIKNIEDEGTTDSHNRREIGKVGFCSFGVESTKPNRNVDFRVGGHGVIDILNGAVKQFGGSGEIDAECKMSCNGSIKQQKVQRGIY